MGDYFDEKEEEEDEDDEKEEGGEKQKKKFKSEYKDVNEIIRARNRINQEVSTVKHDRLERIGRINLELFGDPESNEYRSRILIVQEEMNNPMTRGHPLVTKILPVIRQIKELQIEHDELNKFYSKNFTEIAELLDNCIILHKANKDEKEDAKTSSGGQPGNAPYVSEEMVYRFMNEYGTPIINKFNEGVKRQSYHMALRARKDFIASGKGFFANFNSDPETFASDLMDKYSVDKWVNVKKLAKKNESPETGAELPERNPTQPLPLKESDGTNIPDNGEKSDEHAKEEEK